MRVGPILATFVALAFVGAARPARADGPPAPSPAPGAADGPPEDRDIRKRAEQIANELLANHPHTAVDMFSDPAILDIAGTPRAATSILRAAAVRAQQVEANALAIAVKLIDRLTELTDSLERRTDGGPLYDRAIGFGHLAIAVNQGLRGKIAGIGPWKSALAAARKAGPGDPLTADESIAVLSSLVVAGARAGLDVPAWNFLADELDAFAKGPKGDAAAKRLAVWVDLERGIQLARTDVDVAKEYLSRALPLVLTGSILDEKIERMVGRFNVGLTAALESGLALGIGYRAPVFTARWDWLAMRVPQATGWRVENAKEGDEQMSVLTRVRDGRDKVTIRLAAYSWAKAPDGTTRKSVVDNAAALIEAAYPARVAKIAKVTKESKSLQGRFSKAFSVSLGYEVRGTKADGTAVRIRDWYLRSTNPARWTFVVSVDQEGSFVENDPEIQTILDSLHEIGGIQVAAGGRGLPLGRPTGR